MRLMPILTVQQVLRWEPCPKWSRAAMLRATGGRERVELDDVLSMKSIPLDDRGWIVLEWVLRGSGATASDEYNYIDAEGMFYAGCKLAAELRRFVKHLRRTYRKREAKPCAS